MFELKGLVSAFELKYFFLYLSKKNVFVNEINEKKKNYNHQKVGVKKYFE